MTLNTPLQIQHRETATLVASTVTQNCYNRQADESLQLKQCSMTQYEV